MPLRNSTHPAAVLFSHNSFAIFLAEKLLGTALTKNTNPAGKTDSKIQLIATREVFERVIFLRLKAIYSPAEIIAQTAGTDWMRGKYAEKRRLAETRIN